MKIPGHRFILIAGAVCAVAVFTWYTATRSLNVTHGFTMYYTYARMLLSGEDFARAYSYQYFNERVREYGIEGIRDMPNNIPTNALLLAPLAWMEPAQAKLALSILSFVSTIASLLILLRIYRITPRSNLALTVTILIFVWRPAYDNIYLGQIYALLLLLFCISMSGVQARKPLPASAPVSLAFLFKGYGIVPMLLLGMLRQWRALLMALLWVAVVIAATLPLFGTGAWFAFSTSVVSTLGTLPTDAHVSFQTINSLVYHLFTYEPAWLPSPVAVLPPLLTMGISYLLNAFIVVFVLYVAHQRGNADSVLSYAAALGAGVLTAPLAEEYHFVLFLPLAVGLLTRITRTAEENKYIRLSDWICIAGILVLALPLGYKQLQFATFPLILLAYPKLYAGILLLVLWARTFPGGVSRYDLRGGGA
jgi:hypothetical protein